MVTSPYPRKSAEKTPHPKPFPELRLPKREALMLCLAQHWESTGWKQEVRNAWVRLGPRVSIFQELAEEQLSQEAVGSGGVLELVLANSCWLIPASQLQVQ